jgi:hypothetical protein
MGRLAGGYNDMGMPLQDTIDTFGHLLREVNKLNLAYVALMRYSPFLDPEYDGQYFALVLISHEVEPKYREEACHAARRCRDLFAFVEKHPHLRQRRGYTH